MTISIGDESQTVFVKQFVDLTTRSAIIEQAETMYFSNGDYDPYYGELLLDFIIFQTYVGLNFDNDVTVFEKFRDTDEFSAIAAAYPNQVAELKKTMVDVALALLDRHNLHEDQLAFYQGCSALVESLTNAVTTLNDVLTSAEDAMKAAGPFNAQDMMEALRTLGKKDELKIAMAVLDYQEEKARMAVKADPQRTKPVPHI